MLFRSTYAVRWCFLRQQHPDWEEKRLLEEVGPLPAAPAFAPTGPVSPTLHQLTPMELLRCTVDLDHPLQLFRDLLEAPSAFFFQPHTLWLQNIAARFVASMGTLLHPSKLSIPVPRVNKPAPPPTLTASTAKPMEGIFALFKRPLASEKKSGAEPTNFAAFLHGVRTTEPAASASASASAAQPLIRGVSLINEDTVPDRSSSRDSDTTVGIKYTGPLLHAASKAMKTLTETCRRWITLRSQREVSPNDTEAVEIGRAHV